MEFYKSFLQTNNGQASGPRGIKLAIFGKHPGWDDHIPDIGLATDTLVLLKRILYVRGIGGLIDAGAWDNLAAEDLLDGFNHTFLGQLGGDAVVGRMWASKDGKGRARYPMVVVAHLFGLPLEKCLPRVLAQLEDFRLKCVEVTTAGAVTDLLAVAQASLDQLTAEQAVSGDVFVPARRVLQRMLEREPLGDAEKHRRLLYEISIKLEPFSSTSMERTPLDDSHPGEHLRLPLEGFRDLTEGFIGWLTYLRTQISSRMPVLLVAPEQGGWLDAIVGLFTMAQMRCLRSSLHHLPAVTDIQYNIPPEFAERTAPLLKGMAEWQQVPNEKSLFGAPSKARLAKRMAQAASRVADQTAGKAGPPLFSGLMHTLRARRGLAIGALAGAVFAIAAVLVLARGCSSAPDAPRAGESGQLDTPVVPADAPADLADAWSYLTKADNWFPRLLRFARSQTVRSAWAAEPELAQLLQSLDDPKLYTLLETVGAIRNIGAADLAAMGGPMQRSLVDLANAVRQVETGIRAMSPQRDADNLREAARRNGWTAVLAEVGSLVPALEFNADLGPQIQGQLAGADAVHRAAAAIGKNEQLVAAVLQAGPAVLAEVTSLNAAILRDAPSLAALYDNLRVQNQALEKLQAVVRDAGPINPDLLGDDPRYGDRSVGAVQRLAILGELIEDYRVVDPSQLPELNVDRIYSRSQLEEQLRTLAELEPGAALDRYRSRWDAAAARLQDLARITPVRVKLDGLQGAQREIAAELAGLRSDITKLLADRLNPAGWHANLVDLAPPTPALAQSWKARVDRVVPPADLPLLAADSEQYIARRQLVDQWLDTYQVAERHLAGLQVTNLSDDAPRGRKARFEAIQDLFRTRATGSLVNLLDQLEQPFSAATAGAAFEDWKAAVEAGLREPLAALEAGLQLLEASLEGDGQGGFAGVVDGINQFWPDQRPSSAIESLYRGALDLQSCADAPGPVLFEIFEKTPWVGVRTAVWRRLPALDDWPLTQADLLYAADLGRRMVGDGLPPEQLDTTLFLFWQQAMMATPPRAGRYGLWDFMDSSGWPSAQLPAHWQYDRLVCNLLRSPITRLERGLVVARRDELIAAVGQLPGIGTDPRISAFLDGLAKLTFEDGRQIDPELLEQAGPAAAGWSMRAADPAGSWVTYEWGSRNLKDNEGDAAYQLSFALVETTGGDRFYLAADEVSAGLFFDWIDEHALWNAFKDAFPAEAFGSDQEARDIAWRRGPRAWTLDPAGSLVVAFEWQLQANTQGVPYGPDFDKESPSRFSPVNYLAPSPVAAWAANLGCRLPLLAEYQAACAWPLADMLDINQRDLRWARHVQFLNGQSTARLSDSWPDADCFAPDGVTFPKGREARSLGEADDGHLWFAEVGAGANDPATIRNLHGNLAEYVVDAGGAIRVVGGSAISPPEVAWDQPYPVPAGASRGFSDVGFRLAFDAPVPLPGRILLEAAARAPDLPL